MSHWEKRTFQGEYMIGTSSRFPVFSTITLALLEDTGWYDVDYSQADILRFGLKRGCDFATGSCKDWSQETYFCNTDGKQRCTYDRRAKGQCYLRNYLDPLPTYDQYFDGQPNRGGSDSLADYCPIYVPRVKDPNGRDGWCANPANDPSTNIASVIW
jgi:hypothetical protein